MARSSVPASNARWVAVTAFLVLIGGIALAVRHCGPRPAVLERAPAASLSVPPDTSEGVVERALRQVEGAGDRERWVDEVPGTDLGDLDAARRHAFLSSANAQRCTCGCGYTLAGCRVFDPDCEVSLPRITALLDSVRRGEIDLASGAR